MKFREMIVTSTLSALVLLATHAFGSNHSAADVVKNTASTVIERIVAERAQLDAHPEQIYSLINELVIPHFDFRNMSRLVLGRAWNEATDQQRSAFLEQFKTLLVRTYANALKEYSNNEIIYHPEVTKPGSRLVQVKTEVVDIINNSKIPIDYRMHNQTGDWLVVDVAVDGVSLVTTYRGSFASEINKSGLDSLIDKLVERNQNIIDSRIE
jgi:phospholipid transport system substrate-binding protein